VHRLQEADHVAGLVDSARACGIGSINFDLIYGLPRQSVASFRRTLERVVDCAPDRLSIYQYAHLPERFPAQQRILEVELPDLETRLALQQLTMDTLADAGYIHIGMDHFARPGDPLVLAMHNGTLKRSFQGYTTHGDCELLGMGVSSIGEIGDCLYQNGKDLNAYYESVDADRLAVERGILMNADDHVRKDVIMDIMCHGEVDRTAFFKANGMDFQTYFPQAEGALTQMAADGLLDINDRYLRVTPRGRFLIRNIAMLFDRYRTANCTTRFSKTV
jgi:oxygen-independent coproporphyrinogen-3 oxidase